MPAEPGAIDQIDQIEQKGASPDFVFHVIGGEDPKGLCGSGLVDLIAGLVRSGLLSDRGKFTGPLAGEGFSLQEGQPDLILGSRDIDLFQRAKAAIAAGIRILLQHAGMVMRDLTRVYVGGAFGRFINVVNAQRIGLLPESKVASITLCGNTALAGCELLLVSPESHSALEAIRRTARLVNMSQCEAFEPLFLENLYLKPMESC